MECDFDAGTWACVGEEGDEETVSEPRREVLALLRKHPEGLRMCDIAAATGRTSSAVVRLLARMAEDGEVRREGKKFLIA